MCSFTQAKCVSLNISFASHLPHTRVVYKRTNILIVDDSRDMRRAIILTIKDIAGQIHECSDGSEALAIYARYLPDLVLMDIRMKKIDGLTATREIKAMFPDAIIIVVSSCNESDLKDAARSAGASDYVVKDNLLELRQILINRTDKKSQSIAA